MAIYPRRLSALGRLRCAIKIHILKFVTNNFFWIFRLPSFHDQKIQPTFTKSYSCRPKLTHRVFVPKSFKAGEVLPLYLDIHGGGFVMLNPVLDDVFCYNLANNHNVLVVSVDYPKAPAAKFPQPVLAVIDVLKAILDDNALPIDKTKVAMGGFSAGANLSLAAVQDEELRSRIGGIVAIYPPVDWTKGLEADLATRPQNAPPDPLAPNVYAFDWAYLKPDQDLRDPQLSVTYAPRGKFPAKLYIAGCEFDLLCRNAELMAEKFGSLGDGEKTETAEGWEQNGIKWEKFLGMEHGFDATPNLTTDKVKKAAMQKRGAELYNSIAEWLFREVYI